MSEHEHRYAKLNDDAVFCRCGDIKYAEPPVCTLPHYQPQVYPVTWSSSPFRIYASPNTSSVASDVTATVG